MAHGGCACKYGRWQLEPQFAIPLNMWVQVSRVSTGEHPVAENSEDSKRHLHNHTFFWRTVSTTRAITNSFVNGAWRLRHVLGEAGAN
mmetsp:Transcript_6739/g.5909  ORF Transcript_6739/g.5909 Transcript_6739/m.5909 type:complete len:88 (-) Transcript_6739:135-398(-)